MKLSRDLFWLVGIVVVVAIGAAWMRPATTTPVQGRDWSSYTALVYPHLASARTCRSDEYNVDGVSIEMHEEDAVARLGASHIVNKLGGHRNASPYRSDLDLLSTQIFVTPDGDITRITGDCLQCGTQPIAVTGYTVKMVCTRNGWSADALIPVPVHDQGTDEYQLPISYGWGRAFIQVRNKHVCTVELTVFRGRTHLVD